MNYKPHSFTRLFPLNFMENKIIVEEKQDHCGRKGALEGVVNLVMMMLFPLLTTRATSSRVHKFVQELSKNILKHR